MPKTPLAGPNRPKAAVSPLKRAHRSPHLGPIGDLPTSIHQTAIVCSRGKSRIDRFLSALLETRLSRPLRQRKRASTGPLGSHYEKKTNRRDISWKLATMFFWGTTRPFGARNAKRTGRLRRVVPERKRSRFDTGQRSRSGPSFSPLGACRHEGVVRVGVFSPCSSSGDGRETCSLPNTSSSFAIRSGRSS